MTLILNPGAAASQRAKKAARREQRLAEKKAYEREQLAKKAAKIGGAREKAWTDIQHRRNLYAEARRQAQTTAARVIWAELESDLHRHQDRINEALRLDN